MKTASDEGNILSFFLVLIHTVTTIIPLPVPNWASAEAQFIPNFSLHTKFFIGGPFEAKISIAHHFCQADDDHDDSGGRLQRGC